MSRSPLAYPLNRAADTDVGGAADLQTDVMRFMAILALCLVAIFALVQSIPLAPVEPQPKAQSVGGPSGPKPVEPRRETLTKPASAVPKPVEEPVALTRPQWVPKYAPPETADVGAPSDSNEFAAQVPSGHTAASPSSTAGPTAEPMPVEEEGFTLRFASDAALMRSVAAHRVGVYAIDAGRARRMTVSESRISFWDASTPNAFHEMEADTVPVAVADALARSGAAPDTVQWGVTLPGRMTTQLDALMREHRGGDLIIGAGGTITWEASR